MEVKVYIGTWELNEDEDWERRGEIALSTLPGGEKKICMIVPGGQVFYVKASELECAAQFCRTCNYANGSI